MKSFMATCLDCGAVRKVRRYELSHARQPRCLKCGGPLDLSQSAQSNLADVQSAQRGERVGRTAARAREEEAPRLIPERETKRYEFWEHPDLYRYMILHCEKMRSPELVEQVKAMGPLPFYRERLHEEPGNEWASGLINRCEEAMYAAGRPYYKIWPSIASALCHTDMRVDGEFFRMPFNGIEIRLPKQDNPLHPICAFVAGNISVEQTGHRDGRDWSLVICWHTNVPQFMLDAGREIDPDDPSAQCWIADIPVRRGLSMEDAIDQTEIGKAGADLGTARRLMRLTVGTCFFGIDRHEVILPELRRKTIDRFLRERRQPTANEARKALQEAKDLGLFGFKLGSEVDLPTADVHIHDRRDCPNGEHRELTAGHVRRGHMRFQACGKEHKERRLEFIAPTVVRPDLPLQSTHGYRVRVT